METVHRDPITGQVMPLESRYQHLRMILQDRDMEITLLREEMTRLTHVKKSFRVILTKILDGQAQVMAYLADQASSSSTSRKQPQASSPAVPKTYH